jgi:hypothetical protein
MIQHVIAGLLGGLLASAIVVSFTLWWQKLFVPWLENLLYQGPRVDGSWQTKIVRESGEFVEHAEIEQFGYRIRGTQVYPKDSFGHSHTYSFEGEFRDRTLAVVFRETGSSAVETGAIVLDYKPLGPMIGMQGYGIWRDPGGKLVVEKYDWIKQGGPLAKVEEPLVPAV